MPLFPTLRRIALLSALLMLLAPASGWAREIVDMSQKRVEVPEHPARIYVMSLTIEYMVYAIDPSLLSARTGGPSSETQRRFFRKSYLDLPTLGGPFGNGLTLNLEKLLEVKPDLIVVQAGDSSYPPQTLERIARFGIPIVAVNGDGLAHYAECFEFLGRLLHREKRANELAAYTRKALNETHNAIARIPERERLVVYNSRMNGGLSSACQGSWHAQVVEFAGGRNPVVCATKEFTGIQTMNIEKIIELNPEAMVVMDPAFYAGLYQNPQWQAVQAVKSHRAYLAPKLPINWFDGPPSMMSILGVEWLTQSLYPNVYKKNIVKEAQRFIDLFFGVKLSEGDVVKIMKNAYGG